MPTAADYETADRLGRKRARILPVLAVFFLAQQVSYFSGPSTDTGRPVDHLKIAAWLVISIVLLAALVTGGSWMRPARVRALLNDEVTRAHRTEAFRIGFLATTIAAIALYVLSLFEPLGGRDAVHLLMTVGIAAALLRFGSLERRAYRDG